MLDKGIITALESEINESDLTNPLFDANKRQSAQIIILYGIYEQLKIIADVTSHPLIKVDDS